MRKDELTKRDEKAITKAVGFFVQNRHLFETFAKGLLGQLAESPALAPFIHFIKYRVKDPENLRRKLRGRALLAREKGLRFDITPGNLFRKITDLAGVRVLHLHTDQIEEMNRIILTILSEHRYRLLQGPVAICWDREYETLYRTFGITPQSRESMYTSVHYILQANQQTEITAELQVRTLMEEVWGEVSHRVDYPVPGSQSCRDQLNVLARLTSGSTRLVDSIFKTQADALGSRRSRQRPRPSKPSQRRS
jgi:putative GTP pyrophosphokinase